MTALISSVNVHLTLVEFPSPEKFGAFLYINHNEVGKTYNIYKKSGDNVSFILLGTTTSFNNFFFIETGISTIQYKIECASDSTINFTTPVINLPSADFFVTVEGRYLQLESGEEMCTSKIIYNLEPKVLDFEIGGSVISWNIDGFVRTDDNGNFTLRLPANKGSDGSKIISFPNSYYDFRFNDKSYLREINLDDGPEIGRASCRERV